MPRITVVMVIVGLAVAGGLLLYVSTRGSGARARDEGGVPQVGADQFGADDRVLQSLRASNPTLHIEKRLNDDFNRVPVYWMKDPNSARSILLPKSEAEEDSVVVEFLPCDDAAIPARLKYPAATITACVRVTSVAHVLDAFCFLAKARLNDVVTHYDGAATGRRFDHRYAEETGRDGVLADGTRGFLYSYFLYEGGSGVNFAVDAFVGYKRMRHH